MKWAHAPLPLVVVQDFSIAALPSIVSVVWTTTAQGWISPPTRPWLAGIGVARLYQPLLSKTPAFDPDVLGKFVSPVEDDCISRDGTVGGKADWLASPVDGDPICGGWDVGTAEAEPAVSGSGGFTWGGKSVTG